MLHWALWPGEIHGQACSRIIPHAGEFDESKDIDLPPYSVEIVNEQLLAYADGELIGSLHDGLSIGSMARSTIPSCLSKVSACKALRPE